MNAQLARPEVLSIAGFDPSAGAGVLADTKVFEQLGVYGLSVCTAITYQNAGEFVGLDWLSQIEVEQQLLVLQNEHSPLAVKIGLISDLKLLSDLLDLLHSWLPKAFIVWDPILSASAGYQFHEGFKLDELLATLRKVSLITPNEAELCQLAGIENWRLAGEELSKNCDVLVTGVNASREEDLKDVLFQGEREMHFDRKRVMGSAKHGSGCVFSSALCAYLSLGASLHEAIRSAGDYAIGFLKSETGLLGYHSPSGEFQVAESQERMRK